jgi:hypothetical protein
MIEPLVVSAVEMILVQRSRQLLQGDAGIADERQSPVFAGVECTHVDVDEPCVRVLVLFSRQW